MANLGPVSGRSSRGSLTPPVGQVIARYATYGEAQRAVDFLSDNRFPVQAVTIVGTDLRTVERVTGRLSYGRVALAGALSGAWFGLFVGLVLSLFAEGPDAGVFAAVLIGAGFGMLFGVISYAATGGRRDFTSQSAIIAAEYQLMCRDEQARAAIEVLGRLPHANRAVPPPVPPAPPGPTDPPPTQAPPPAQAAGEAPGTSSRQDTIGSPVPPPGFQRPTDSPYAPPPGWGRPADDAPAPTAAPGAPGTAGGVTEAADGDPGATPSSPPAPIGPTYGEIMEQRRREQREREAAERVARAEAARLAAEAAAEGQDAAPRD